MDHQFHKIAPLATGLLELDPKDKLATLALAKAYFYTGKEESALELLPEIEDCEGYQELANGLYNHFNARQLVANKLGVKDAKGAACLGKAQKAATKNAATTGIGLTAAMIVKNEEKFLAKCLESIKSLVDEIVIVDTGSTDSTIKIAKQFGAKVIEAKWDNDFSAARNIALNHVTTPWALWIDADETIPSEGANAYYEGLMRPQFCGFNIPVWNFLSDNEAADQYVHTPTRLFQMLPGVAFTGKIHETVTESIMGHGLPVINLENAVLHHFGYTPTMMVERNKLERNQALLEAEVKSNPTSSFQWYNLGNNLTMLNRLGEAEAALRTSLRVGTPKDAHRLGTQFTLLQVFASQAKLHDVLDLCDLIELEDKFDVTVDFQRASALMHLERLDEALQSSEQGLTREWIKTRTGDYSIFSYKKFVIHGQILCRLGRYEEGIQFLQKGLKIASQCAVAGYTLAEAYRCQGNTKKAEKEYAKWQTYPETALLCSVGLASLYAEQENWIKASEAYEAAYVQDTTNHDLWTVWVDAAEKSGDATAVLKAYEAYSYEGVSTDSDVLVNWGRALIDSGEGTKAISCFSEAIKRDPRNANAYFNCGDALYQAGQFMDAAHIYESGLRIMPTHANGWFVLGNALAQIDVIEGARVAYRQALALDPTIEAAQHNLEVISAA